ncbi:MAG: aldo/keto reductase [Oscillospiraceae bacterium]|nr:aldo/keto reductase [Oscillospiraceae bacterium]
MKTITLGSTNLTTVQNAFGALPMQRISKEAAVELVRAAYDGGMRFFDTARAYSDSEEKLGLAFGDDWRDIILATKTQAKTPADFWVHLETSLKLLKREYIDIYQFHCVGQCYRPGDGTGMYECMLEAKAQGKIRHIGITTHKIGVAEEAVASGLYETLQYPISYLSTERELALAEKCKEANMGLIAMKALAGGLITNAPAAFAFIAQYDNVLPIWGIQKREELEDWLSFFEAPAEMTEELRNFITEERQELVGEFCRGCGYCMPCPAGIQINNCARMSLMLRRAPSTDWLTEQWQANMKAIEGCLSCGQCSSRCPYELDTPELLKRNLEDYRKVLAGEVKV